VSSSTLFIASSYSGNTEETLAALAQAEDRQAKIIAIASGGKLAEIAQAKSYPLLKIPQVSQPRFAVFYNLNALVAILVAIEVVNKNEAEQMTMQASEHLQKSVEVWAETVPTAQNPAKRLAMELAGKSIAIYGGPLMAPAAYKWKISFNENSKNVAWWNEVPEFDHNELTGWSSHPIEKPYGIVEIRSSYEHERVQKRFEVGEKLLSGRRPAPHVIEAQGSNILEHLVWSVAFGDFVSIYLALLNNVNPTPVDLVEKFKTELST
jgi:glucose/mannose-6-phosphate isomerase